ncbi:uncharacterized protein LOC127751394 [Frankliniella occidentalis]|uniref:Uncharacterized protein LOC127751394 n=1 Tax=Frankliniella occidentalis TaxID=133901 RepID=A0A9C6XU10_FRAOC|nr:uncharacterized protein LOC127751394 [Frankliniella occidentalis]
MGIPLTALLSTVAALLLVRVGASVPEGAPLPEVEQQTCDLALAMLSPHLATTDGYPPQLYVTGRARWLGCLLAGLPPAAVVLVDAGLKYPWIARLSLARHNTLALVLVEDAAQLDGWRWPARLVSALGVRTLVWVASAPQDEPAGLRLVQSFAKYVLPACVFEVRGV